MSQFPIHTLDTAPADSKPHLLALKQTVGMIPNLAVGMAESPGLIEGFLTVRERYAKGTLTGAEIQALSLTAALENDCGWCMAFHTAMARTEGVSSPDIDALRDGRTPPDAKLGALTDFAREMVRTRGAVSQATLQRFLDAGYTRAQALEVILGMAFSLMANYAGHIVNPALDAPLQPHAWQRLSS
jgi:AhpD family alkylhydroperoxidase